MSMRDVLLVSFSWKDLEEERMGVSCEADTIGRRIVRNRGDEEVERCLVDGRRRKENKDKWVDSEEQMDRWG